MKSFLKWIVGLVIFVVLYLGISSFIGYLISGRFGFNEEMRYGVLSYVLYVKYFFVADPTNSGWAGVAGALGVGSLIGIILLVIVSFYLTKVIFRFLSKEY